MVSNISKYFIKHNIGRHINIFTILSVINIFTILSVINIFDPFLDATLDTVTYSCPCENTDVGRYNPTWRKYKQSLIFFLFLNCMAIEKAIIWWFSHLSQIEITQSIKNFQTTSTWIISQDPNIFIFSFYMVRSKQSPIISFFLYVW